MVIPDLVGTVLGGYGGVVGSFSNLQLECGARCPLLGDERERLIGNAAILLTAGGYVRGFSRSY
jgi:hypothetical protein